MTDRTTSRTPAQPDPSTTSTPAEAAVLDAAADLLVAEGPHALSIRRIASAARVSPMTIYNRFESKSGVLDALFTRGFDRLADLGGESRAEGAAAARRRGDPPPTPLEDLRAFGLAYRRFALGDPGTYALMFDKGVADWIPAKDALAAAAACFARLVESVTEVQDAGQIVGGDAVEVAQRFWATMHGAVSLERHGICFAPDTDQHYEALLDTILAGLRPEGGIAGGAAR